MTSKGHERREGEQRNSWGLKFTSPSPSSTGSPVIVMLDFFVAVRLTFTNEQLVILNLPWHALCREGADGGSGGALMSRESDGMFWSSFGHLWLGTSWFFVWQILLRCTKLSINNCWHFLCLDCQGNKAPKTRLLCFCNRGNVFLETQFLCLFACFAFLPFKHMDKHSFCSTPGQYNMQQWKKSAAFQQSKQVI